MKIRADSGKRLRLKVRSRRVANEVGGGGVLVIGIGAAAKHQDRTALAEGGGVMSSPRLVKWFRLTSPGLTFNLSMFDTCQFPTSI